MRVLFVVYPARFAAVRESASTSVIPSGCLALAICLLSGLGGGLLACGGAWFDLETGFLDAVGDDGGQANRLATELSDGPVDDVFRLLVCTHAHTIAHMPPAADARTGVHRGRVRW